MRLGFCALAVCVATVLAALPAGAVSLHAGDLLVADGAEQAILRVDPVSGTQTVVASGGLFQSPAGIAIDGEGRIFVTDANAGAVLRVDPATGAQTVVSSGGSLRFPHGLVIDAAGDLLVADGEANAIVRVDRMTGAQTIVSSAGSFSQPVALAIDGAGDLFMGDRSAEAIFRVDPVSGAATTVVSGAPLQFPADLAFEASGGLLVTDLSSEAVFRVDPATGSLEIVSSGGGFDLPVGIAVESDGALIVSDEGAQALFRVDPQTGAQTLVASGGFFQTPFLVAVVPQDVPAPGVALHLLSAIAVLALRRRRRSARTATLPRMKRATSALPLLLTLVLAVFACGEGGPAGHGPGIYEAEGTVESVLREDRQLVVAHEDIEGLMPAMTMSFDVADPSVLEGLEPGQRIAFHLEAKDDRYRILDARVLGAAGAAGASGGGVGSDLAAAEGEESAPPFSLTSQAGETVSLEDLRGKTVLLDFIYTHCPGPCPILTSTHVRVQRTLPEGVREKVRFVSISLDPERDTPEALREYAEARGADLSDWSFLTGSPEEVDEVLRAYGAGGTPGEDGEIIHVVVTYLIDPQGHIAKRYVGLEHHADDLRADVERVAAQASS